MRRLSLFPTKRHSKFIDIEVKVEELATTGAERRSLATYDSIKKYCLDNFDIKVTTLYITQVKHKLGFPMRPNYRKAQNPDYVQPQCPPEKEEAIMKALQYYEMI